MTDAVMRAGIRFFLAGGATGLDDATLHRVREAASDECARRSNAEYERQLREALGDELADIWLSRGRDYRLKQEHRYLTFRQGRGNKRHIVCGIEIRGGDGFDTVTVYSICRASASGTKAKTKERLAEMVCDKYPVRYPDICWNCMR